MRIITRIKDRISGKAPHGEARSGKWPAVRAEHLKDHPRCAICGGTDKIQVHHKVPFHLDRALETNSLNLISLCESRKLGVNCHLHYGHLGDFKAFNPEVEKDAKEWSSKIMNRPYQRQEGH